MTCIHGLDEINCPSCRVLKSTVPLKELNPKSKDLLRIKHPLFKFNRNIDEELISEVKSKKIGQYSPNFISKPHFINEIPNFKNELFYERVKALDLTNEDNHGIAKKIPLANPKWEFEEEE